MRVEAVHFKYSLTRSYFFLDSILLLAPRTLVHLLYSIPRYEVTRADHSNSWQSPDGHVRLELPSVKATPSATQASRETGN